MVGIKFDPMCKS